jgi:hypothetical protein
MMSSRWSRPSPEFFAFGRFVLMRQDNGLGYD